MPWPPKIATAKPRERPSAFDAWYLRAQAKTIGDMPMATEILYKICDGDEAKFNLINDHMKEAFEAGRKSK